MSKKFTLVFLFIAISKLGNAQLPPEKQEIQSVITRFFEGLSELNGNKIRAQTSVSFTLLEHGQVWNVDSLIKVLSPLKTGSFTRVNKFNFLKTEQEDKVAWVSYENFAEMKINGNSRNVKWLESAVLIKENNEWKIDLLHSTVLK